MRIYHKLSTKQAQNKEETNKDASPRNLAIAKLQTSKSDYRWDTNIKVKNNKSKKLIYWPCANSYYFVNSNLGGFYFFI